MENVLCFIHFCCLTLKPVYFCCPFTDRAMVINIFKSLERIQMRKMPEGQVQVLKPTIYVLARDDIDTEA